MRLCFYTHSFLPQVGGAELVLHNLATQLVRRGESVVVVAPRLRRHLMQDDFAYPVVRYARPSSKRLAVRQTLIPLAWQYWRQRFQVLHCHSGYPAAYVGATFRAWFGIPLVVRPHGADILPDGSTRRHPRLARRLRHSLQAADAVIAQGRFLKEVLLDLGVDAQRIYVIHNGVDIAAFAQAQAFDYPRPYMLGVGKFMRHKGFDVLLRAYARLRHPTTDLLLAGQGPEQPRLERLAHELGIADRVKFLGFLSGTDKLAVFKSAQFSICPSRREPFANVILEALAAGLPVVASAVGGNTELIGDGVNGLLFPSEDDAALARALQHLLNQPALIPRLRAAIPALIRPFDWPLVAARYLALYQELAARGRRRRAHTLAARSDHAGLAGLARREL